MKQGNKIKIAMADDHAMLRRSLCEVINNMDEFQVLFDVNNGKELMEKLTQKIMLPDICILDINMPEMNGYETAKAIKQFNPQIKILALSMYDNEFNIIRMLRSGASGYVLKDSDPMELRKALIEIYEHGFYQTDKVKTNMLKETNQKELSENELQFLQFSASELTYKEIAEKMIKSPRTIDGYREDLFAKLNISSRTGLVMYAIRSGLVVVHTS